MRAFKPHTGTYSRVSQSYRPFINVRAEERVLDHRKSLVGLHSAGTADIWKDKDIPLTKSYQNNGK